MSCVERAIAFGCVDDALVGILSLPSAKEGAVAPQARPAQADTGVIIVVGGPQYRAGSHRQFTLLARAIAEAGTPVLRFDYRGMGDSTGVKRNFEEVNDDVAAAIDALQQQLPEIRRVVLWGLCDGASAALLYLHITQDPRVRGVCLANPWIRTDAGLARTHLKHYYLRRLRQPEFWRKVMSGGVAAKAASELWHNLNKSFGRCERLGTASVRVLPFQERMAQAATWFGGSLLLVTSGLDLTAKEFLGHARSNALWQYRLASPLTMTVDFANADHTFSSRQDELALHGTVVRWLGDL